ncbi:unnamed protein product, partial [Rotaria sp. Silwood2]
LDIMSIDHSHLFLRYVQFEFAQPRNLPNTDNEYDNEPSHIADCRFPVGGVFVCSNPVSTLILCNCCVIHTIATRC